MQGDSQGIGNPGGASASAGGSGSAASGSPASVSGDVNAGAAGQTSGTAAPTGSAPTGSAPTGSAPTASASTQSGPDTAAADTPANAADGGSDGIVAMLANLPWRSILIVLAIILVIVVVVALVTWAIVAFVRWRRRKAAESDAVTPTGPSLARQVESIWQPFYRNLPRHARQYPTVIVMGDAGVGKSTLIDAHVDWRGQAREFYPSATKGTALQLYLGPGIIAHEISAALLRELGRDVKRALSKMWRRLGSSVAVVVVVDASTLSGTPEADLRALAQLVRGKLRLLPKRVRRQAEVRVCLSHMDQVDGYGDFAQVVGQRAEGFSLTGLGSDYSQTGQLLDDYQSYLSYALTRRPASAFAQVVSFFAAMPALTSYLAPLLRTLAGADPFAARYRVEQLYGTSLLPDSTVGEPFAVDYDQVAVDLARQQRRHRRISMALTAALLTAVTGLHIWRMQRVQAAEEAVTAFATAAETSRSWMGAQGQAYSSVILAAERRAASALGNLRASEILWLGRVADERQNDAEADFVAEIRAVYLLPLISAEVDRNRLVYELSLLYAAKGDALGTLVLRELDRFAERVRVPTDVMRDYIEYSEVPYQEPVTLPAAALSDSGLSGTGVSGTETGADARWRSYLDALEDVFAQAKLTATELDAIQKATPTLANAQEYQVLGEALELLAADADRRVWLADLLALGLDSPWVRANYDTLVGLTGWVTGARLTVPNTDGWLLAQLLDYLETAAQPATASGTSTSGTGAGASEYTLVTDGRRYRFARATWDALMQRSRAGATVETVLARLQARDQSPFFRRGVYLPAISPSAAASQGPTVAIDGQYTSQAFADYVYPVLARMPEAIANAPLTESDANTLANYVRARSEIYARRYRQALEAYYLSFRFDAGSADTVTYHLRPLTATASWFGEFLHNVSVTAAPTLGDNEYFMPMERNLQSFAPLAALLVEDAGTFVNLAPFTQAIATIQAALDNGANGANGAGDAGAADDMSLQLAPVGTLALDTLQGTQDDQLPVVRAWLAGANIPGAWQEPFVSPIEQVYQLGYRDIERAVVRAWDREVLPLASDLLARFPFRRRATAEVSVTEMEEVLRLQGKTPGTFWQAFMQLIEPVLILGRDGRYQMRSPLRPPRGMLRTVNDLLILSERLWDGDGNRLPLSYRVTPQPLSLEPIGGRLVTLAYLKVGTAKAYAFNQQPSPRTLSIDWWAQDSATVGVQLTDPDTGANAYSSSDVNDATWSLFRLLARARRTNEGLTKWQVPVILPSDAAAASASGDSGGDSDDGDSGDSYDVSSGDSDDEATAEVAFAFEGNPWALFRIGGQE